MKKIKVIPFLICLVLLASLSVTAYAENAELPRVVDKAELLSTSEETALEEILFNLRLEYGMDFVFVTDKLESAESVEKYADDYYDENGYGAGNDSSGVLILLNMGENRSVYTCTCGKAISLFDSRIDKILDKVIPYFSEGEYYEGALEFASLCDRYASGQGDEFPYLKAALVSLAVGYAASLITVLVWRGKLKSVQPKKEASDYLVKDSFNLTLSRDNFLYANVTRTKRPEGNSSNGGSGTHVSSGGVTHGGGGRSF